MNDDPEQVDILYGQIVDTSGRLQRFGLLYIQTKLSSITFCPIAVFSLSDALIDSLESDGLLDRQYQRVKLHATLMNSIFATEEGGETRQTFNAKPILEVLNHISLHNPSHHSSYFFFIPLQKLKNFDFGTLVVEGLHLSERYSTSPTTKYYKSTSHISLV